MTELETKADRMLELWTREVNDFGQRTSSHPLDGSLALSEVHRHTSSSRMFQRDKNGDLIQVGYSARIHAKESKRVVTQVGNFSPEAELIESLMVKIRTVNGDYFNALALSYALPSMQAVATKMNIGLDRARRLRKSAFDMVCVMLMGEDVRSI